MSLDVRNPHRAGIVIEEEAILRLTLTQAFLRECACGHLPLQIRGMTKHFGVQTAVLIDPPDLGGEHSRQALIFCAELIASNLVNQANVPIELRRRNDRRAQQGINGWIPCGETKGSWIAARIDHPNAEAFL